ncbi:MAG: aminotransferase class V-fold PLP-dependent enzyme [bacterium]|nr:aminotransferase class V-fold PLP-dependent enzyme [bacterium]
MIYFTPGPSQLYPTVKKHMTSALRNEVPSLSHRSAKYQEIVSSTVVGLRTLLTIPKTHSIFFVASGTEAMERIVENCVTKNSFHFINGAFSKRFFQTSIELKKNAKKHEVAMGQGFDFEEQIIPKQTELVCFTQNETSTGVSLPMDKLYELKKQNAKMLFVLDIVSSAPYVHVDFRSIDVAFFSVQKGFGLPAGLGVMIVGPDAIEKAEFLAKKGTNIGSYHNFLSLKTFADKYQTPETPNVLGQYLLGKVIGDMLKKGMTNIRKETEEKAALLYRFFDRHNRYIPFVKEKMFRSKTVITVVIPDGSKSVVQKLKERGFVVDRGYGELKETQIRIANFPATSKAAVNKLIARM